MKRNKPGKSWLISLISMRSYRLGSVHNDKILPETRWSAFLFVPLLLSGFVVLTFWPDDTDLLFAWSLKSRMTALLLGAVYAGGAYFFSRVYLSRQWHRVGLGYLPATTFALLGGLATLFHWDEFSHSSPAFLVWIVVYAITPWLIPLVWFRNRSLDPRVPDPRDVVLPRTATVVWVALGISNLAIGACLFIFPTSMSAVWPWVISPLGARVIGSLFAMFGVTAVALAIERRWSAQQVVMETMAITFALLLLGEARSWSSFQLGNALTWVFTAWVLILMVAVCVLYLWVEIR
jgi:hypothetical protein